jgi:hypothetical protein
MAQVYQINKGVGRPIVFRGIKAQYIGVLAVGLLLLLLGFAGLYLLGVSLMLVVPLVFVLGTGLFMGVFRMSRRFGEHGLSKLLARRRLPGYVRFCSRRLFVSLKEVRR